MTYNQLSREQLKNVLGGWTGGSGITSGKPITTNNLCFASYIYEGGDDCGYVKCMGAFLNVDCDCRKEISSPQPCAFA